MKHISRKAVSVSLLLRIVVKTCQIKIKTRDQRINKTKRQACCMPCMLLWHCKKIFKMRYRKCCPVLHGSKLTSRKGDRASSTV